jgi:hypothetical protein
VELLKFISQKSVSSKPVMYQIDLLCSVNTIVQYNIAYCGDSM